MSPNPLVRLASAAAFTGLTVLAIWTAQGQAMTLIQASAAPQSQPSAGPKGAAPQPAAAIPSQPATLAKPSGGPADPVYVRPVGLIEGGSRVNLKFPGGTLTDFIEALRKAASPAPFNVLKTGEGVEPLIPPCEFQDVTITNAVSAAAKVDRKIRLSIIQEDEGAPVYVFSYGGNSGSRDSSMQTDVLSLRGVLDAAPNDPQDVKVTMTSDTVLAAVQQGAMTDADEDGTRPAMIRFHEESELLFVRGTHDQIETIRRVVSLMESDVQRKRNMYDTSAARRASTDIKQLEIQIEFLRASLDNAMREADRAGTLVAQGALSDSELSAARQNVLHVRADLDKTVLQLQQAKAEYASLVPPEQPRDEQKSSGAHATDGQKPSATQPSQPIKR